MFFEKPVVCVVTDQDAMPVDGTLRKISNDKEVYPFFQQWYLWKYDPPDKNKQERMLEHFMRAALHCPIDYVYIAMNPALDMEIFKKSVAILEQFRKDEEKFATGGWQYCCISAKASNDNICT